MRLPIDEAPEFTRHAWSKLWRLVRPFFFGRNWGRARGQLGAPITLLVAVTGVGIRAGFVSGDLVSSLQKRDTGGHQAASNNKPMPIRHGINAEILFPLPDRFSYQLPPLASLPTGAAFPTPLSP